MDARTEGQTTKAPLPEEELTRDPSQSEGTSGSEPPRSSRPEPQKNIAVKAIYGLFWLTTTGLGSRVISLVCTLLLTRYVSPTDYGEVQNTYIVVWMVDMATQLGLAHYIAGRAELKKRHIDHAIFFFQVMGVVAPILCLLVARPIGPLLGAPHMYQYMPGFVAAVILQRFFMVPDRLLVRDLRFRASGALRAVGELTYAFSSLGFAFAGKRLDCEVLGVALVFGGGFAIVWGNVARGLARVLIVSMLVPIRRWFVIPSFDKETTRHALSFGVPITLASLASFGARRWDNLAIGNLYGSASAGIYNFAYNLADVPPTIVGEAFGDVLTPSLVRVAPEDRMKEVIRWTGFSALVCFPLGVGLSSVAPSLAGIFDERWAPAILMVTLLGSLSITRPLVNPASSYLQTTGRTRTLMVLEWGKAIAIVALIAGGGRLIRHSFPDLDARYGPRIACIAIGVVLVLNALSYHVAVGRVTKVPLRSLLAPAARPLMACIPMIGAVLLVRLSVGWPSSRWILLVRLVCEILAGALVYIAAAFFLARPIVTDLIGLFRKALFRRIDKEAE